MSRNDTLLAYIMLLPAFLFVMAIVLFPVLTNAWISFKPLSLSQLRAPSPTITQRLLQASTNANEALIVALDFRNTNTSYALEDISLEIVIPKGFTAEAPEGFARGMDNVLRREAWIWPPRFRERLVLQFLPLGNWLPPQSDEKNPLTIHISFQKNNPLFSQAFTIENFRKAIVDREFLDNLWTTFAYSAGGALGAIIFGLLAALLAKNSILGRGGFRALLLFPYVCPIIAATLIWVFLLDPFSGIINELFIHFGLIDEGIGFLSRESIEISLFGLKLQFPLALTSLIFFDSWRYFPFTFLFILARLGAISPQWYEAAEVDGAGPFQKFFFITLPQLMGVITTLFILRFMWTFNKFDDVFLLTGGTAGTKTLPVQVYDNAFGKSDIGAGAAVAMLLFLFLALFLLVYNRYKPEDHS